MDELMRQLLDLRRRVEILETHENHEWIYPHDVRWVGTANLPLTSTSWDGDSFSDTAKTLIDLSAVFGTPAKIHAVYLSVRVNDSLSTANETYIILAPDNTPDVGQRVNPGYTNDRPNRGSMIVPCNADGDIYYQIEAGGVGTFDVVMQIWGYEI